MAALSFTPRSKAHDHLTRDFPADDVETDALRYNQLLEQGVLVCPEQYYWIHKKFKNLPEPHENYYANIDRLK